MGMGYYQFRLVGRYWSRRYIDLCNSFIVPPGLENRRKPCGGSNDNLCGNVRRPVSYLAHGPCMDGFLCIALSKYKRPALGKLQLTIALGCICDINLLHC